MKTNKGNQIFKVVVTSALSIGVLSAAFIGVNTLAFAAASNTTEIIQPNMATANIDVFKNVMPMDYQKPTLTVYEAPNEYYQKSANAISAEEATEFGAQYIWEVFGESIDGKIVEISYSGHPSSTRAYWHGTVVDSREELENHKSSFRFTIDAVSGERISLSRTRLENPHQSAEGEEKILTLAELEQFQREFSDRHQEQIEEYMQIAVEYAGRHFNNSSVVNATFESIAFNTTSRSYDFIAFKGDIVASLTFRILDDTGREATVLIENETKRVFMIDTSFNDIVPGFNADVPGSIG